MTKVAVVREPLVHRHRGCAAAGHVVPLDREVNVAPFHGLLHPIQLPTCHDCGRTVGRRGRLCFDCVLRRDP